MKTKQRGFTIIELMLAMTFIAFIMIFVIMVVIQATAIYNKGLVLRQINQAGRQIGEDLGWQARAAKEYAFLNSDLTPRRLCIGGVTYAWNLRKNDAANDVIVGAENKYDDDKAISSLVRVSDPAAALCTNPSSPIPRSASTELLGNQVAIFRFDVPSPGSSVLPLINVNIVLGTRGNNTPVEVADIDGDGRKDYQCLLDGRPNQFCAVAEFNNVIYMRGK